jgi:transposase InsO family protein
VRRGELFRVVAYYSKQSTREQKYYHSYELETLAVVSALRYFRVYLIGIKFRVVTDCSALRTTFAKKDLGHTGIENTLKRMQKHYWFARMRSFVTKYVRACLNCAYYKQCTRKKQGKLHPIEKVSVPFHTVHVDHVGPFETSAQGNKFLLVIVDAFTKFVIMEAVKSQKTQPVVRVFQQVMCLFGVPTRIISDRGSAFTSHSFKLFCETYNIRHVLNAVATPRANGQCERYNRTIVAALTTLSADTRSNEWDTHVKEVQSAMSTTFNKGIKTTPSEALMGYQPRPAAQAQLLAEIEVDLEHLNLAELRAEIQEHITTDQARQKQYYDKHRREADKYSKDDLVLVLITSTQNSGSSKKLLPKFRGPFRVVAALFNDRYVVEDLREGRYKSRTVVAVEKLRPWTSAQV